MSGDRGRLPFASEVRTEDLVAAWWDRAEQFRALLAGTRDSVCIQLGPAVDNVYIQAGMDDDGWIVEAVSNTYLPEHTQLSIDDECSLLELGWQPPTGPDPNFFRHYDSPVDLVEVATDMMLTFAVAFHALPDAEFSVSPADALAALDRTADARIAVWLDHGVVVAAATAERGQAWWMVVDGWESLGAAIAEIAEEAIVAPPGARSHFDAARFRAGLEWLPTSPNFSADASLAECFSSSGDLAAATQLMLHFAEPQRTVLVGDEVWQHSVTERNWRPGTYERLLDTSEELELNAAWIWFLAQTIVRRPELLPRARRHSNRVVRALAGSD